MLDSTAGEGSVPALLADKYRLEREVGRGGMGVVYQATHLALRQTVAIKIVLPELAQNPLVSQRLLREARCAAQIGGEHVVRVIDVGQLEASGQPFIVMEYVDGEDLARRLGRSGRLSLPAAVHAVLEACVAIAEAHAKGIVHRDLKPGNLFVARAADGRELIKVLDFGISKQLDAAERPVTRPNDVMGSPNYMAPEQICAPLAVDSRADLWALGAILVELATGKRAFPGETITAVYTRVLTGEPELPEPDGAELPSELVSIVSRCLRKDPGERFQSVHELVAALAPFAPPASAPALRAIARFGRTALEGAGGATATYVPGPFASVPKSSPPVSSSRAVSSSPPLSGSVLRRSPGWVAAGVGLGLTLSAAVIAPPALRLEWGPWHRWITAQVGARSQAASSAAQAESPPQQRSGASLVHAPAFGTAMPAAATTEAPSVRVLAHDTDGAPVGEPRGSSTESSSTHRMETHAIETEGTEQHPVVAAPRAAELHAREASHGVAPGASHEGSLYPSGEPRRPSDVERSRAAPPAPEPPLRNPWDVTTFGGRS